MKKRTKYRLTEDLDSLAFADSSYELNSTSMQVDRIPRGIETEENRIYFYCPVAEQEALELNRLLRRLDVEMKYLTDRLECTSIPIHLHIHSPGGSIFSALSIVDTMESMHSDVYTYIDGSAASAATLIASAGTPGHRYTGKNSFMLIHQPYMEWAGKRDEFIDEIQNQEELYKRVKDIYLKNCTIKSKKLDKLLKHELWLPPEKCIEIGLVDKIYGKK